MKKGSQMSIESRKKISDAKSGVKIHPNTLSALVKANKERVYVGKKWSEETMAKMLPILRGRKWKEELKMNIRGENHYRYIKDRSTLVKRERTNPTYNEWRNKVFTRDNFKCRVFNKDCCGGLQAHHILNWVDYPELRFDINNGIALCHAHHPRGRANEKRLSPFFMDLVSVSKENNL